MPGTSETPPARRVPGPARAVVTCLLLLLITAVLFGAGPLPGAGEPAPAAGPARDTETGRSGASESLRGSRIRRFLVYDIAIFSLLRGAQNTLVLTAASMPLAVILGVVLALLRLSRSRWLSWPAAAYVEVMRGTPLMVQIFVVYFSLPQLGQLLRTDALTLAPFTTGIICLSANYAAYEAEIIRAGLEAVDRGQREAALSLGMSEAQAFFLVVLPQAFRIVVPPLINDLIAMLKDSCLVNFISVRELLERATSIGKERGTTAQMMIVAAVIYLGMSLACYFLGKYLERRLKVRGAQELHVEQPHGH